eukprot:4877383-Amphidinium_carterae.1
MATLWVWFPRHSCKVKAEIMHGQGGSAHSSEQVEVDELTVSVAGYPSRGWGPALSLLHPCLG